MSTQDPYQEAKNDLEAAKKKLQEHQSNPLGWDTSGEPFKSTLAELEKIVAEKQKALEECASSM